MFSWLLLSEIYDKSKFKNNCKYWEWFRLFYYYIKSSLSHSYNRTSLSRPKNCAHIGSPTNSIQYYKISNCRWHKNLNIELFLNLSDDSDRYRTFSTHSDESVIIKRSNLSKLYGNEMNVHFVSD